MRLEHGKYARVERERRYWLSDVRIWACDTAEPRRIADRYIIGTRLRLRAIHSPDGSVVFKLTQKILPEPDARDFSRAIITTTYLTRDEYIVLSTLPSHEIAKSRYRYPYNGRTYSIDVFNGNLRGLMLAETAFDDDAEMEAAPPPPFAGIDVSDDPRFVGMNLAQTTWRDLQRQLDESRLVEPAFA